MPGHKDAADIQLSIDAVDIAHTRKIETFALASSDRDLSLIAHRLREMGRQVVGLGLEKAPASFRFAFDSFHVLTPPATPKDKPAPDPLDVMLQGIFAERDPKGKGILLNKLNGFVQQKDSSFRISKRAPGNWPKYLGAKPVLYRIEGEGTARRVYIVKPPCASGHRRHTDAMPT